MQRLVDKPSRAPEVVAAAAARLDAINNLVDLNNFGNNLLFGLSQASVLLLSAIGLAITFGVMRVINMAHGEFIMIGAYRLSSSNHSTPRVCRASRWCAVDPVGVRAGLCSRGDP